MLTIASEPIQKTYNSRLVSRSFLLSAVCCIFAFIVPILLLVSIGYSWDSYQQVLLPITFVNQNYQISCLLLDGTTIYDSTLMNEVSTRSYKSFISVSSDGTSLGVTAFISAANVSACSILLYIRATTNNNYQVINVLPLSFYKSSTSATANLVQVTQKGSIYIKTTSALPQSYTMPQSQASYYGNNTQTLSMIDTHLSYNAGKNLSLFGKIRQQQDTYSSVASSMTYTGQFQLPSQTLLQQTNLLTNIRKFVPFFIYIFILVWMFLAKPTVRWMLENKIYKAKVQKPKIKTH